MTETLKPCPFCGEDNAWHDSDGEVICADCGAMGPEIASIHRDDNAAAWNRRASPPSPSETLVSRESGTPERAPGDGGEPSAARGLAQTLRSYAGSPCLSLDLSHTLDCAAEVIEASEPTPEALEAWAEWFDRHPEIGVVIVIAGDAYSHGTPGYLLREIARRMRAVNPTGPR